MANLYLKNRLLNSRLSQFQPSLPRCPFILTLLSTRRSAMNSSGLNIFAILAGYKSCGLSSRREWWFGLSSAAKNLICVSNSRDLL